MYNLQLNFYLRSYTILTKIKNICNYGGKLKVKQI